MKKNKRILTFLIIISICMFSNINNVNATNKTYKANDLVVIKINDTTGYEFYILEDSDESSDEVTAIFRNVLGEEMTFTPNNTIFTNSLLDNTLKQLTSTWSNPTNIRLINKNEVQNNDVFRGRNYLYWTQTIELEGAEFFPYIVNILQISGGLGTEMYSIEPLRINDANKEEYKAYIRPVITIKKEFIEERETDKLWTELTNKIKENIAEQNNEKDTTSTVTVTNDRSNLQFITTKSNGTYETKYTYKNGIIELVNTDNITSEQATINYLLTLNILSSYAQIKGYSDEEILNFLIYTSNQEATLENDGYEFTSKTFEETTENSSSKITVPVTFSIDANTLDEEYNKCLASQSTKEENQQQPTDDKTQEGQVINVPNTASNIPKYIFIISLVLIGIGSTILIKTIEKNN